MIAITPQVMLQPDLFVKDFSICKISRVRSKDYNSSVEHHWEGMQYSHMSRDFRKCTRNIIYPYIPSHDFVS